MTKPALTVVLTAADVEGLKSRYPSDALIEEANHLAHLRCMADELIQHLAREVQKPDVVTAICTLGLLTHRLLADELECVKEIEAARRDEVQP